jgi:hypothetical protein
MLKVRFLISGQRQKVYQIVPDKHKQNRIPHQSELL